MILVNLFTPENAAILAACFFALTAVFAFLAWLAPRTATKLDDEAVANIERAKAFAAPYAHAAWEHVESADKAGLLPLGVSKAVKFVEMVQAEYERRFNQAIPREALKVAEGIAAGLSAGEHAIKEASHFSSVKTVTASPITATKILSGGITTRQLPANPTPAPSSR